ncbi:hypothetical protein AG1IA_08929 [Rhizoctonia solani AG-1 IA]|uniref:Uncharacterized protein n=1 Tax=Thanatephorus cucumeris (strain AG1-IA) TaxID=983506 RepID=L8WJQ3_THACA|nr:hypothetical protein AG1IA_08929 [Rhizoctonia solani AG-1 IA]
MSVFDDLPPPYYTEVTTLETEHRDVASLIQQLSRDIVNCDQLFYDVGVRIEGRYTVRVAPPELDESWRKHKQTFKDVIWAARGAATKVQARNADFIDVILPSIGNPSISMESKLEELKRFISASPLESHLPAQAADKLGGISNDINPILKKYEESADKMIEGINAEISKLETERDAQREKDKAKHEKGSRLSWFSSRPGRVSIHAYFTIYFQQHRAANISPPTDTIELDSKIDEEKSKINTINKQREEIKSKLADIRFALNTIPEQVGQSFMSTWTHLTNDATHIKNRMEGSTSDPMPRMHGLPIFQSLPSGMRLGSVSCIQTQRDYGAMKHVNTVSQHCAIIYGLLRLTDTGDGHGGDSWIWSPQLDKAILTFLLFSGLVSYNGLVLQRTTAGFFGDHIPDYYRTPILSILRADHR